MCSPEEEVKCIKNFLSALVYAFDAGYERQATALVPRLLVVRHSFGYSTTI